MRDALHKGLAFHSQSALKKKSGKDDAADADADADTGP
jgi:hypothetical protein